MFQRYLFVGVRDVQAGYELGFYIYYHYKENMFLHFKFTNGVLNKIA